MIEVINLETKNRPGYLIRKTACLLEGFYRHRMNKKLRNCFAVA